MIIYVEYMYVCIYIYIYNYIYIILNKYIDVLSKQNLRFSGFPLGDFPWFAKGKKKSVLQPGSLPFSCFPSGSTTPRLMPRINRGILKYLENSWNILKYLEWFKWKMMKHGV